MGERCAQPCGLEARKHARCRCFCLSPCENAAPCHAPLSTIMTARAASARHATLQSDVPRRVVCQCRACGTRCDVRVVPACSAVCMRNSVSVSLGICRTAASFSVCVVVLFITCACPCLFSCGMMTERPVENGSRADASGLMQIEECQFGESLS